MPTKSLLIAAAVAMTAFAGGVGTANAGGNHHMSNNFSSNTFKTSGNSNSMQKFHHRPHLILSFGNTGGCSYFYDRWQYSGSLYWKHRYFECIGY